MEIDQSECAAQIDLWRRSWTDQGWEPCVLNLSHASLHPEFRRATAILMRKPTVNYRNYEIACFHRWLALSFLGGGWMTDYDVVNLGFKPKHAEEHEGGMVLCETPCVVYGSKKDYDTLIEWFLNDLETDVERGNPHYSDQAGVRHWLRNRVPLKLHVDYPDRINEPGHTDWLVHVKTDHAQEAGVKKSVLMWNLLNP